MERYTNFKDFYPYYLSEHSNKTTKLLHFIRINYSYISLHKIFHDF